MSDLEVDSITDVAGTGTPDFPNGLPKGKMQTKVIVADITTDTTFFLTFNGLTIGRCYEYSCELQILINTGGSNVNGFFSIEHDGVSIDSADHRVIVSSGEFRSTIVMRSKFIATATTVSAYAHNLATGVWGRIKARSTGGLASGVDVATQATLTDFTDIIDVTTDWT